MAFPTSPSDGDRYKDYQYNSSLNSWKKSDVVNDWAYMDSPNSLISNLKNSWDESYTEGPSLSIPNTTDIVIEEDGIYEIYACQRCSADGVLSVSYIQIAINGANNYTSTDVASNHDDSRVLHRHTEANYIGSLSSGDIITVGAATGREIYQEYGVSGFYGGITVRRLD